jgi:hypothetical protein
LVRAVLELLDGPKDKLIELPKGLSGRQLPDIIGDMPLQVSAGSHERFEPPARFMLDTDPSS